MRLFGPCIDVVKFTDETYGVRAEFRLFGLVVDRQYLSSQSQTWWPTKDKVLCKFDDAESAEQAFERIRNDQICERELGTPVKSIKL